MSFLSEERRNARETNDKHPETDALGCRYQGEVLIVRKLHFPSLSSVRNEPSLRGATLTRRRGELEQRLHDAAARRFKPRRAHPVLQPHALILLLIIVFITAAVKRVADHTLTLARLASRAETKPLYCYYYYRFYPLRLGVYGVYGVGWMPLISTSARGEHGGGEEQ